VVISNTGLDESMWRFIPHLAVTVALQPPLSAPVLQAQRDTAKSAALLQEALALMAAQKATEASVALEAALQADDRNSGAWIALTELRARTDTAEAFTALCRKWFAAMPENYQAHNVLGRFMEGKGRIPEAMAEYRASLAIEWNQPFIMQALEKLGKK
jgi:Tfp pilus assembly protein PilF